MQLWYHDAVLYLTSCGLFLKVYGVLIINSYHEGSTQDWVYIGCLCA
jgi:hypothetical protein